MMTSTGKNLRLYIFFIFCAFLAKAEKVMRPKFKEINLWSDPAYVTHSLTYDANDPHLNFTMNVIQDIPDIDVQTDFRIAQKTDPTYYFSTNSSVNVCRILHWRTQSPVGTLIHNFLQEYGKLVDNCPITKGDYEFQFRRKNSVLHKLQGQYYMHKIWWPEDTASATIPELDFEMNMRAFHVDASKKRTLVINDHIAGEGLIQDVAEVKRGILAMLPKAG